MVISLIFLEFILNIYGTTLMGTRLNINQSLIISREGLILTLSILLCPQGRISWSTPCRKIVAERMSVLHQNSGGIGKSIPSALQISLDPSDDERVIGVTARRCYRIYKLLYPAKLDLFCSVIRHSKLIVAPGDTSSNSSVPLNLAKTLMLCDIKLICDKCKNNPRRSWTKGMRRPFFPKKSFYSFDNFEIFLTILDNFDSFDNFDNFDICLPLWQFLTIFDNF